MPRFTGIQGHRYWVAVVFFLLAGAMGLWVPALSNVMARKGFDDWTVWAFVIPCFAGMVSPIVLGAQVDQRFQAQKVLAWVMLLGAVFLFLAFYALENDWGIGWFMALFAVNAVISAPGWSLLTTISLSGLRDPGRDFGRFRVWATIGWMMAGALVSWWGLDFSAKTGQLAAGVRVLAGLLCFLLPITLPKGVASGKLSDALGLGALKLLKDRDQLTYFVTVFLFTIPLQAYYLYTPQYLAELGVEGPSLWMASAQVVETVAMLGLGAVIVRFRIKAIFLVAIGCGVLRYYSYSVGHVGWLLFGITLHGICWTFFYEAGRVFIHRRVDEGMRGQAQALIGLATSGLGGVVGLLTVRGLHELVMPAGGWSLYWLSLSGLTALSFIVFSLGYRGLPQDPTVKS